MDGWIYKVLSNVESKPGVHIIIQTNMIHRPGKENEVGYRSNPTYSIHQSTLQIQEINRQTHKLISPSRERTVKEPISYPSGDDIEEYKNAHSPNESHPRHPHEHTPHRKHLPFDTTSP